MKKIILAMLSVAITYAVPGALKAATLVHNPVLSAAEGQDIQVSVQINGNQGNTSARLYYRQKGKELFKSAAMIGATVVRASIPGKYVELGGVEYYVEVRDNTGTVSTPNVNPKLSPHFVSVRKDEGSPDITIMSPQDGETLDTDTPVITASFYDDDSGIEVKRVRLWVDGKEVKSSKMDVFETLLSYVPTEGLGQGSHRVRIRVQDGSGNSSEKSWSFSIDSSAGTTVKRGQRWFWSGNVNLSTQYAHDLDEPDAYPSAMPFRPYGVNRARANVTGRGEDSSYRVRVFKTDEERIDQQPVDRYMASYTSDEAVITVGDSSPNFSRLSLYQLAFLRGVTLDLRSGALHEGHSRFMFVGGQTSREVNAGVSALGGAAGNPAFEQYLYGARYEAGGKYMDFGLNVVTANDLKNNAASKAGIDPVNNFVQSSDMAFKIPQLYFRADGELAYSFYAADPTPLSASLGVAYLAGAQINAYPYGTRLNFEWRDTGGQFPIVSEIIPAGYTTLGNPGLESDYRGFESGFSQNLMDGQMTVGVGFNSHVDNLTGQKYARTTSSFVSANMALAFANMPYLNVSFTNQGNVNDASGNTITPVVPEFKRNDTSNNLNINLGYTHRFEGNATLNGNVSYVMTQYRDEAPIKLSQGLDYNNVVVSLFSSMASTQFNISAAFGNSKQLGLADNGNGQAFAPVDTVSNNYSARISQVWIPGLFNSGLSWDLSSTKSDTAAIGLLGAYSTQSTRNTFTIDFGYEPATDHRVNVGFSYATSLSTATGQIDNQIAQLLSSLSYNYTF